MDYVECINRIPEPLTTRYIWDNDDEHRGHSTYTGHGSGKDADYWDCYCMWGGCKPPTDFKSFLKYIDNAEQVLEWKARYKFTLIVCFCWCCHGADPVVMFGWPKKDNYWLDPPFDPLRARLFENPEEEPKLWTAASNCHAFLITEDDKLIYHGEVIYKSR